MFYTAVWDIERFVFEKFWGFIVNKKVPSVVLFNRGTCAAF